MCRRRDSIEAQNAAADALTRACTARRTVVAVNAKLLRDPAPLGSLPDTGQDFDGLLERIDRQAAKATKQ